MMLAAFADELLKLADDNLLARSERLQAIQAAVRAERERAAKKLEVERARAAKEREAWERNMRAEVEEPKPRTTMFSRKRRPPIPESWKLKYDISRPSVITPAMKAEGRAAREKLYPRMKRPEVMRFPTRIVRARVPQSGVIASTPKLLQPGELDK